MGSSVSENWVHYITPGVVQLAKNAGADEVIVDAVNETCSVHMFHAHGISSKRQSVSITLTRQMVEDDQYNLINKTVVDAATRLCESKVKKPTGLQDIIDQEVKKLQGV